MRKAITYSGVVLKGKSRGKKIGFPTANLKIINKKAEGIFASSVRIENRVYPAATFIGAAKTYGDSEVLSESYILDFNEDIYGKEITVTLYNKIRKNFKFKSESELISQIKKDVKIVAELMRNKL